jgi:hypothetical protein
MRKGASVFYKRHGTVGYRRWLWMVRVLVVLGHRVVGMRRVLEMVM